MIIGIDASRANNEQRTGVEEYAFQLIQELKKIMPSTLSTSSGQVVRVILYTDKHLEGELGELPTNWSEKVLNWPPFGSIRCKWRFWTQIRLSWEMLFHAPDVLFIPAHVFPFIHPKKTIMTVHDVAAIKFPKSYNWFERWYSVWSAKHAVKKLWQVITPSEFTKSELINLKVNKFAGNKIEVIYLGYNKKYQQKNEEDINKILEKYNLKKPYLLSVGRLEEKKNTVNIVKAFEDVRRKTEDLKLVVVGKPGFGYEKVKQAIENSEFKNDIILPGWVKENDLPYLMNAAEIFIFPSLYEGFGLPVLEAFACGCPVIVSRGTSLEEVGGEAAIYVDQTNLEELSSSITKLLNDRELRENLKIKGLERVKQFSWEKCAKEILALLLL